MSDNDLDERDIEALAKKLCKARHPGLGLDTMVMSGEPFRVAGGYIVDPSQGYPLWTDFLQDAEIAFEHFKKNPE